MSPLVRLKRQDSTHFNQICGFFPQIYNNEIINQAPNVDYYSSDLGVFIPGNAIVFKTVFFLMTKTSLACIYVIACA